MLSHQIMRKGNEILSNLKIFAEKLCDLQDDEADWHLKVCRNAFRRNGRRRTYINVLDQNAISRSASEVGIKSRQI